MTIAGDSNCEIFRTKRSREQAGLDTSNRCRHPLKEYYWFYIVIGEISVPLLQELQSENVQIQADPPSLDIGAG